MFVIRWPAHLDVLYYFVLVGFFRDGGVLDQL